MYILRGLPGAGKSTLADSLATAYLDAAGLDLDPIDVICEADQYFMDPDGVYRFDPSRLKEAHEYSQKKALSLIRRGSPIIIVSNTSTKEWEFAPYMEMGHAAEYAVFSLIVENRHEGESIHGVPEEALERMAERFEISL
jgi:tRNA uridine 5-carbamoylmethylation protein Kti12